MDADTASDAIPLRTRYVLFSLFSVSADFVYGAVFVTVLLGRGVEPWALGSMLAANIALGMVLEAPSGALGDRYGHRRLLCAGLAAWGVGFAVFGGAEGLPATVLGLALGVCGHSLQSGTLTAIVVNRIGDHARVRRVRRAVRWGQVASRGGSVLGAGAVLVGGTWARADTLVLAAGAALVVLAALTPLCLPADRRRPGRPVLAILRESAATITGRRFRPLVFLAVSTGAVMATLIMAWQPLLLAAHGEDVRRNGLVLLVMTLGLMAGAACSRFTDRLRPQVWGPVFALATGVPLVLLAFGWLPLVPGLVVAEFFLGVTGVVSAAWQQLMYADANRNTMFSAMAVVSGVTYAATQWCFGWLWELGGLPVAISVLVAVSAVAALLTPLSARFLPASVQVEARPGAPRSEGPQAVEPRPDDRPG
ncbi:MFS transporter [Nocardiopsis sp. NRRL B-16309]|uniref:MFS transporter n=1 Tax=Nocardiopsis sp. NRRL B-16309 TaxID=1519494 RepID=UPI0006ADAA1A|nr:MFS transporter [Nocardiopsis sp. NRRL B-16309]KOX17022.1 MFS transporter [Nocardiopsis sp. NRRL B-16309]